MKNPRHAFTLVELLVVIGIIGVIIAILLPALASARRHSQIAVCTSNLRQITSASLSRAHDSRGYLPLAGTVVVPVGAGRPGGLAAALNDSERNRYRYVASPVPPTGETIAPLHAVLAPYLGVSDLHHRSAQDLSDSLTRNRGALKRIFSCPSTVEQTQRGVILIELDFDGTGSFLESWDLDCDYAPNAGVMGYHYAQRYQRRRYNANLTRVKETSRVVMFTDAKPVGGRLFWQPSLIASGADTLGAALRGTSDESNSLIDARRHQGKINVSFADGHVETIRIEPIALDGAQLLSLR